MLLASAYLPPARYMAAAVHAGEIVIEQHETYPKQTCRNHCNICGPNGIQTLSIPVSRVNGNHTLTRDIRISDHEPWQRIHWRSIETAYSNSPFFLFYQDSLRPFYEKQYSFLVDLNTALLETLFHVLGAGCSITLSESYQEKKPVPTDLRDSLAAKHDPHPEIYRRYTQVFEPVHGFIPGLSILDLIANLGPETGSYLHDIHLNMSSHPAAL